MFWNLCLLLKNSITIRRLIYFSLASISFVVGTSITKGVVVAIDNKKENEEDPYLAVAEVREVNGMVPGSFLIDLSKRMGNLLNVNALDDEYWLSSLKVNNKELTTENLLLLKNKCREIYNFPISKLNENPSLKKEYEEFVKFNCRKPRTSLDKFRQNGILISSKNEANWIQRNTQTDPKFWARVEKFNSNSTNTTNRSSLEKLKNYCKKFPKENPTSFKSGYSQEEREYIRYCL